MLKGIYKYASCHCKTNFKREDWIEYFKSKIRKGI